MSEDMRTSRTSYVGETSIEAGEAATRGHPGESAQVRDLSRLEFYRLESVASL